jgi:beta-1,2-mannobiose phosphorylase / 1,2-beta-oligomannan phosphorylase
MATVQTFLPGVERLNGGAPILMRIDEHPWENKVTFNPACVLVEDKDELHRIVASLPFSDATRSTLLKEEALCFMLYRAQGSPTPQYDHTRSSMGLAVLTPDLRLLARAHEPVLRPTEPYENLGVEDGRLTKVNNRYFLFYTAYASGTKENRMRIAAASTTNFVEWDKHGLINGGFNTINNKNGMLFDVMIDGKHLMLHRPMQGSGAMQIHWAESDAVLGEWKTKGVLMNVNPNPKFIDTWIGGGAPPIGLPDGRFLMIYHIGNRRADLRREYYLAIAIIDPRLRDPVVRRDEPLLRPMSASETIGDLELGVDDVVFVCGAYFYHGDLYFPYAGADSVVLGGKIAHADIQRYLM